MLSSPRNSVTHNQQAKLAIDYNELLKELSSHEMTSVGCYAIGDTIGEGTFGKVKKGVHKLTGRQVAIKKISKQHAPMMAREIHHHRQLKHPNIIMLYEMITTESTIHIISEYAPNGDLLDALTDSGRCDEHRVRKWVHQLTDAISYCHTRGIVHRDLKLENILLDMDDNVKICDFGFARFAQKNQYLETFCGSLSYSAPEIILRKKYSGPETDIWSLGVIIYTLLAGEYPFDDDSEVMTQRKIVQVDYQMPSYFSPELSHLIDKMLKREPSDRITIHEFVDHPWYCQTEPVERILSPSSSTSSANQSDVDSLFSQDTINEESDISTRSCQSPTTEPYKFSPQVRSSLGLVKMEDRTTKSPRFSAPAPANRYSKMPSTSYRTSLPSVFPSYRNHLIDDTSVSLPPMTPGEKRLFTALNAAGFDRDALVKMQTGECDTSSTLWHLLLENMESGAQQSPLNESVSDAFASALSNQKKEAFIDRGIQTTENLETVQPAISANTKPIELPHAYPSPVIPPPAIQTVGFGSNTLPEKGSSSGWLSSVKSWFGSSKQQPPKQTLRSRSSSNCSTVSSPIPTPPSSYRNFDSPPTAPDAIVMSPPIYRSGSQKYRRRMLQLAQPPVSELDQLAYSATSAKSTRPTQLHYTHQVAPPPFPSGMPSPPAPTAALCPSMRADTFSILTAAQPKEVDICEKRYSMYRSQQPTPPPSPPIASVTGQEEQVPSPVSPLEEKQEHELVPDSIPEGDEEEAEEFEQEEIEVVEQLPIKEVVPPPCNSNSPVIPTQNTLTLENNNFSNRSRFEFAPRSRLSLYGMQDQRASVTASKTIIEEEEEEEE